GASLALISSMSSLASTTTVFMKLLQELQRLLTVEEGYRDELLKATYEEILRGVGDAQRPLALRWWFANCGEESQNNGYSVVNPRSSL
ncbi:14247_t:CDS:1, partial [Acaulospora colombiana]